nr:IQ motif and SEC7 domain-containing protein 1 isoform X3 [Oryctolagus cuniculus]
MAAPGTKGRGHGSAGPSVLCTGALLACLWWLSKIQDPKKPQKPDLHQQEDFLWKDLLVVTTSIHGKMDSETPSSVSSPFLKRC